MEGYESERLFKTRRLYGSSIQYHSIIGSISFMDVGVEEVVLATLHSVLEDEEGNDYPYHPDSINSWTNDTISIICDTLTEADREKEVESRKVIVHVVFCQSTGAGLHASTGAVWDPQHDNFCIVQHANTAVNCIVTVYTIANPKPPNFQIPTPTHSL